MYDYDCMRHRREADRALAVLLCLVLAQRAQALPIVDRFVQNLFEPDRLNRWYALWEKVIHLTKFHIHNVPRILMMPFSNINAPHRRAMDLRKGLTDLRLKALRGRMHVIANQAGVGGVGGESETRTLHNYAPSEQPGPNKNQEMATQPVIVRAKQ
ncbi:uncharacterized protein LOC144168246 [Haemaphysalis longicornis]